MPSFSVPGCLENLESRDPDKRFMGLNDLLTELLAQEESGAVLTTGVLSLSEADERRLVDQVVKLLPDESSTVQEQAVKAIGPLSARCRDNVCKNITNALSQHLLYVPDIGSANSRKQTAEELRDISSIGIKGVIGSASLANGGPRVVEPFVKTFLTGLSDPSDNQDVVGFVIEGVYDLLTKFASHGIISAGDNAKILKAVQPQLGAKRPLTRKRAISCLGLLASSVPDALFADLTAHLIEQLGSAKTSDELRTYIQAITAVSRAVGYRIGKVLPKVVPKLIAAVEDEAHGEDDDLRESAFACFETMLLRCSKDVSPFVDDLVRLGLQFVKHDPNYEDEEEDEDEGGDEEMPAAGDDEEDAEEGEDGEDDEDMEGYEDDEEWGEDADYDEELSDDDDMSWKVRRSAAKVLGALVETRRERLLTDVYGKIAPTLVRRFGEREENVRLEVFSTFADILRMTRAAGPDDRHRAEAKLVAMSQNVVKHLAANIKAKNASVKGRSGVFSLLREILTIPSAATAIAAKFNLLVPGVVMALSGEGKTDPNLKIDTLTFLKELMSAADASAFVGSLQKVGPLICEAANDNYYRISAEGLKACKALVPVMVVSGQAADSVLKTFTDVVLAKLEVQDIDQEVKDAAIACTGSLFSELGSHAAVKPRIAVTLGTLRQRLRNEITRLTAVRTVGIIASSKEKVDLSEQLANYLSELSGFLRKANRQLKQASLVSLRALIAGHCSSQPETVEKLVGAKEGKKHLLKNAAPLLADGDLQLSHLTLQVGCALLHTAHASSVAAHAAFMDNAFSLLRSPLVQGLALSSLLEFFSGLVTSNAGGRGAYPKLLEEMRSVVTRLDSGSKAESGGDSSGARTVIGNVARAIASITSVAKPAERAATVQQYQKIVSAPESQGTQMSVQLALMALGEIGRRVDAAEFSGLWDTALTALSSSTSEETKQAASVALGSIAVGNVAAYLPRLLSEVQGQKDEAKYLLLHALREVIIGAEAQHATFLRESEGEILPLLFSHCEIEDEGTRNIAAECLGKLALGSPHNVLAQLVRSLEGAAGSTWRTRATAVTAVKFMVVDQHKFATAAATTGVSASAYGIDVEAVNAALQQHVGIFADSVKDEQLDVRRAALMLLNFAAHHAPHLLRARLATLLPLIYAETAIRLDLIREVDLGPFKHKVDDGLGVRKAAYEAMYTLLETCPDAIVGPETGVEAFIKGLVPGLRDEHDIRVLVHLVLVRLARVAGTAIIANGPASLDSVVDPLKDTLEDPKEKPKDTSVKQDVDRYDERVRTVLKAVAALDSISGIHDVSGKFDEFVRFLQGNASYAEKFEATKTDDGSGGRSVA